MQGLYGPMNKQQELFDDRRRKNIPPILFIEWGIGSAYTFPAGLYTL